MNISIIAHFSCRLLCSHWFLFFFWFVYFIFNWTQLIVIVVLIAANRHACPINIYNTIFFSSCVYCARIRKISIRTIKMKSFAWVMNLWYSLNEGTLRFFFFFRPACTRCDYQMLKCMIKCRILRIRSDSISFRIESNQYEPWTESNVW